VRLAACALPLAFALTAAGCEGRPRSTGAPSGGTAREPKVGPAVAVLDLSRGVPESPQPGPFGVAPRGLGSFDELVRVIDRVGKDKRYSGILVRFGGTALGAARASEVGELLETVGKRKPVYCHADGYTNATLYAAARGCKKVYVAPAGEVESVGIAAEILYMHRLLAENLYLTVDILQVGKFKGAEEPLTRDGPSAPARESLVGTLADMRDSWLDGIRRGRGGAEAGDAAEDGPFGPEAAKERGLVDEVGYADDARDALKKECGAVREETRFGPGATAGSGELDDLVRLLAGEAAGASPVALVRATGSISMSGGGVLGGSGGITEKAMSKTLLKIEKDDDIKALVLRIDSPGGSALASDLIWHDLMRIRAKKPVVVSVGDMAASGGYYLASTGNVIFAEPMSIVGSIGVVGGKLAFGNALEKIGVHAEAFAAKDKDPRATARATYGSPLFAWDDATRERVREGMKSVYDLFLSRVAEGRKLPVDAIAAHAEGRIFSGREGKARGLVDELGGLTAAIAKARELAKLAPDARVEALGGAPTLLEALGGDADAEESVSSARDDPGGDLSAAVAAVGRVVPELVPFAASLAPLASGERVLTAVPYAVVVR
jgi:protease IV